MSSQGRTRYHHGDLKRALMDAALRLVAEGGTDAFTMAEAAREAGVSTGAPYRHFKDRSALMCALADEGLDRLDAALEDAVNGAGDDPWRRLQALGSTEVGWALQHPSHFRVMNAPEYQSGDEDQDAEDVEANRRRLRQATTSKEAAAGLAAQCAIYGMARMVVDGHLGPEPDPDEVQAAVGAMLSALRRS